MFDVVDKTPAATMRFGAVFPHNEIGSDTGALRDLVVGVEALGFHHLLAYDHVLGAPQANRTPPLVGPYDEHDPFHELFVLFGHLAALTKHLELVSAVLVAPQRQTALIAKQAAELQLLSDGRFRLGVGTGWNWVEYESMGASFAERGAMLDEQIVLLRRWWTEPTVTFHGRFHDFDRAGIVPLPAVPIPIWIGGYGPAALRRTARLGEGHLFGHLRPDIVESARSIHRLARELGRDPSRIGLEAIDDFGRGEQSWIENGLTWRDAGGSHLTIRTASTVGVPDSGCRSVDDHLRAFERWRDAMQSIGVW